jgi:hypothetical protein
VSRRRIAGAVLVCLAWAALMLGLYALTHR